MPNKNRGFTQSSYPAYVVPSDEDYKTLLIIGTAKLVISANFSKQPPTGQFASCQPETHLDFAGFPLLIVSRGQ